MAPILYASLARLAAALFLVAVFGVLSAYIPTDGWGAPFKKGLRLFLTSLAFVAGVLLAIWLVVAGFAQMILLVLFG